MAETAPSGALAKIADFLRTLVRPSMAVYVIVTFVAVASVMVLRGGAPDPLDGICATAITWTEYEGSVGKLALWIGLAYFGIRTLDKLVLPKEPPKP